MDRRHFFHIAGSGTLGLFLTNCTSGRVKLPHDLQRDQQMIKAPLLPQRHDPFPVADPYHGIYAHGVEVSPNSPTLYISGQVGVAPDGSLEPTFEGQCRQAFKNVFAVLDAANMSAQDIVKMSFFLTSQNDMDKLVDIRKDLVDGVRPAVTTLFVSGLVSPDWFVEIEAVAAKKTVSTGLGMANY